MAKKTLLSKTAAAAAAAAAAVASEACCRRTPTLRGGQLGKSVAADSHLLATPVSSMTTSNLATAGQLAAASATSPLLNGNAEINYELSHELQQKQIECLNRKYGGHLRARRAARTIQLAYREYRLRRNYVRLCENTMMKRRSLDVVGINGGVGIDLASLNFEHVLEQNQQLQQHQLPAGLVGGDYKSLDEESSSIMINPVEVNNNKNNNNDNNKQQPHVDFDHKPAPVMPSHLSESTTSVFSAATTMSSSPGGVEGGGEGGKLLVNKELTTGSMSVPVRSLARNSDSASGNMSIHTSLFLKNYDLNKHKYLVGLNLFNRLEILVIYLTRDFLIFYF